MGRNDELRMIRAIKDCKWEYRFIYKEGLWKWVLITFDISGITGMKSSKGYKHHRGARQDLVKFLRKNFITRYSNLDVGMIKKVPIEHSNKEALVDKDDYVRIRVASKWYLSGDGRYAVGLYNKQRVQMHRFILKLQKGDGLVTDHKNRNGLDNRKKNLRTIESHLNNFNRGPQKNSSSGYKGVYYKKQIKKWGAAITHKGKKYNLGYYKSKVRAALAYKDKAMELHG